MKAKLNKHNYDARGRKKETKEATTKKSVFVIAESKVMFRLGIDL